MPLTSRGWTSTASCSFTWWTEVCSKTTTPVSSRLSCLEVQTSKRGCIWSFAASNTSEKATMRRALISKSLGKTRISRFRPLSTRTLSKDSVWSNSKMRSTIFTIGRWCREKAWISLRNLRSLKSCSTLANSPNSSLRSSNLMMTSSSMAFTYLSVFVT